MPKRLFTDAEEVEIAKIYKAGFSEAQIAKAYGLKGEFSLRRVLKRQGVVARGCRIFTDAEEVEIGKIYLAGYDSVQICKAYGLPSPNTIRYALKKQGIDRRHHLAHRVLYTSDSHAFDILNQEASYFYGYLFAEGCTSGNTLALVNAAQDLGQIERFKNFVQSTAPIREVHRTRPNFGDFPAFRIDVTNPTLVARLKELGITTGRPHPELIAKHLPPAMLRHFLRGHFDGDGCVHLTKKGALIAYFCGPEQLLTWIRSELASQVGMNPSVGVRKHKQYEVFYLFYGSQSDLQRLADFFYKDATVWLERKRRIFESRPALQPKLIPPRRVASSSSQPRLFG